jgi:hypothetical protein
VRILDVAGAISTLKLFPLRPLTVITEPLVINTHTFGRGFDAERIETVMVLRPRCVVVDSVNDETTDIATSSLHMQQRRVALAST